jgi:hypothetical protein
MFIYLQVKINHDSHEFILELDTIANTHLTSVDLVYNLTS